MLHLQRITTADPELYTYMEELLIHSFPADEYRDLEELRNYSAPRSEKPFYNNIILEGDTPVGLLTYWDFQQFCYIEHFAIDPAKRNGGYGKEALKAVRTLLNRPIVLEVEEPNEEMAQRRIGFYQREGFQLWPNAYQQPPYKPGCGFLPMQLMVYGALDNLRDFETIRTKLYTEVYKVNTQTI